MDPHFSNQLAAEIHTAAREIELNEWQSDGTESLKALDASQRNPEYLKQLAAAVESGELSADQRAATLAFIGKGKPVVTRSQFEAMGHPERMEFAKKGGKVIDDEDLPRKAAPRPTLSGQQMFRSDFDKLSQTERAAKMKEGYRLIDG